nr:apolipoprotein D-like [Halyomorpha halys]
MKEDSQSLVILERIMSNLVNYYPHGKSLTIQLFIILGSLNISGAVLRFGQCLSPPVVENFDIASFFTGRWYEIQSNGNELFQGVGTCSALVSRVTEDDRIVLKTYSYKPILENYVTIDGSSLTQIISNISAVLPIRFDMYGGLVGKVYQAQIIDTDYINFAVVYLCKQGFIFKSEMAYLLSRSRNFVEDQFSARIGSAMYTIGLTASDLRRSINSNCGYNEPAV